MRQIVLDTETTGLETSLGHRIIEIGAVEMMDRKLTGRHFHKYVNPQRAIDDGAFEVHGISAEFLADKPLFAEVAGELLDFLDGANLIIHNAPFDVAFLDNELSLLDHPQRIADICTVTDSLALARHRHPGQKNSLDALCRRYEVDDSARQLHGALLDAEILADVYLAMTGGQTALFGAGQGANASAENQPETRVELPADRPPLRVIAATADEMAEHEAWLQRLEQASAQGAVWRSLS